jgi:hypothetical protein
MLDLREQLGNPFGCYKAFHAFFIFVKEAMRISFLENLPDESTPTQFFRGVWKAHFPLA